MNIGQKLGKVPRLSVVTALIIAGAASIAAVFITRSTTPVQSEIALPRAARVQRVRGEVGVCHLLNPRDSAAGLEWHRATPNVPLSAGDRLYVGVDSDAGIEVDGRRYIRLNSDSLLDVVSLAESRTQLALRQGSAMFDIGERRPGELIEVATPSAAVDFLRAGLYQIGFAPDGNTLITVLDGLARVVGMNGSSRVGRGQMLTLLGASASQALVSELSPVLAGNLVDSYYSYRYGDSYDGRYADYEVYLDDAYLHDRYGLSESERYVSDPEEIAGLHDLDEFGNWRSIKGRGECWTPWVKPGWSPYRDGYWLLDGYLGLSWVSNEPWGWAPYHYGRWAFIDERWYWTPGDSALGPVYSPALVAFVQLTGSNDIGWGPLGPGDAYTPRYYDRALKPTYTARLDQAAAGDAFANVSVAAAVSAMPASGIAQGDAATEAVQVDSRSLAGAHPVTDPFSLAVLRRAVLSGGLQGPKVAIGQSAQHALESSVVTTKRPLLPSVLADSLDALNLRQTPAGKLNCHLDMNAASRASE